MDVSLPERILKVTVAMGASGIKFLHMLKSRIRDYIVQSKREDT
tara:strand:+ start:759 stop:890 length:132 start_codon:yes stop_codon:yes gene_type:complete